MSYLKITLFIFFIIISGKCFSCVTLQEFKFNYNDLSRLLELIDADWMGEGFSENEKNIIYEAKGNLDSFIVYVDYKSDTDIDGAAIIRSIRCVGSLSELWCDPIMTKRTVRFISPNTYVELVGEISVDEASKVLTYLQTVLTESEQYKVTNNYHDGLTIKDIDRIQTIKKIDSENYRLTHDAGPCFIQNIDISRLSCDSGHCEFKLTKNCLYAC